MSDELYEHEVVYPGACVVPGCHVVALEFCPGQAAQLARGERPTITFQVKGRPVPDGGNCPECDSYDVGVVAFPLGTNSKGPALEFTCNVCDHAFRIEGEFAEVAFAMLEASARGEVNPWIDAALRRIEGRL